jgi:hypothetical protein
MASTVRPPSSTRPSARLGLVLVLGAALTLLGCGSTGNDQSTTGAGPQTGATGSTTAGPETGATGTTAAVSSVEVLDERRTVVGVATVVVHDVVRIDDEIIEETFDWYAQDVEGNVWYFGEDTTSYEGGAADKAGSWEAGVEGALPGIVMPAGPAVSDIGYRQEFWAGKAKDMGQVIAVSGSVTVPAGTFDDTIRTRDWTPLEPDIVEEKVYARDVGLVSESKVDTGETEELVEYAVR